MRTTLAALAFLASFMLGSPVYAQIVSDTPSLLIAVRHADTLAEPGDRSLSDAGIIRSQALAVALRNAGVTAIITSQFRRSRDTAQPIASALGLTPEVIPISRTTIDSHMKQLEEAVRKHKIRPARRYMLPICRNTKPTLIATLWQLLALNLVAFGHCW